MITAPELFEMAAALWILVGMTIGAVVIGGCAGNISAALVAVIGNAVNFVMISALVIVVLAWVVITGPFWLGVLAFQGNAALDDDDERHQRGW